jgi:hypothetical protein
MGIPISHPVISKYNAVEAEQFAWRFLNVFHVSPGSRPLFAESRR